jgi:hypothetical protein
MGLPHVYIALCALKAHSLVIRLPAHASSALKTHFQVNLAQHHALLVTQTSMQRKDLPHAKAVVQGITRAAINACGAVRAHFQPWKSPQAAKIAQQEAIQKQLLVQLAYFVLLESSLLGVPLIVQIAQWVHSPPTTILPRVWLAPQGKFLQLVKLLVFCLLLHQ